MSLLDIVKKEISFASGKEKMPIVYSYYSFIIRNKEIQELLAQDQYERVRNFIFASTNYQEIIKIGKNDPSVEIRAIVADRTKFGHVLHELAEDKSLAVRRKVALNPNIRKDTARMLAEEGSLSVISALIENKVELLHDEVIYNKIIELRNPLLTLSLLEKQYLPEIVIRRIANDIENYKNNSAIITRMLGNRSTPLDILLKFARYNQDAVLSNKRIPEFTRILLKSFLILKEEGKDIEYLEFLKLITEN